MFYYIFNIRDSHIIFTYDAITKKKIRKRLSLCLNQFQNKQGDFHHHQFFFIYIYIYTYTTNNVKKSD